MTNPQDALREACEAAMRTMPTIPDDEDVTEGVYAAIRTLEAHGFKVVGREPTSEMVLKGDVYSYAVDMWPIMVDAAPSILGTEGGEQAATPSPSRQDECTEENAHRFDSTVHEALPEEPHASADAALTEEDRQTYSDAREKIRHNSDILRAVTVAIEAAEERGRRSKP